MDFQNNKIVISTFQSQINQFQIKKNPYLQLRNINNYITPPASPPILFQSVGSIGSCELVT